MSAQLIREALGLDRGARWSTRNYIEPRSAILASRLRMLAEAGHFRHEARGFAVTEAGAAFAGVSGRIKRAHR